MSITVKSRRESKSIDTCWFIAESPSDNEERSVKHKKSVKKDISDEANNQDQNQSQIKKQEEKPSIAVKEEKGSVHI